MERSEPTFMPEWLKTGGSLTGASSVSHSDDLTSSRIARNKSFLSSNSHDFGRSSSSDRTTSSYFRRSSSSNGSRNIRSYSSFDRNQSFGKNQTRIQNEQDHEKNKHDSRVRDRLFLGDSRHRDSLDPVRDTFSSKFDMEGIRQYQSLTSGKRADIWPKKVVTNSSSSGNSSNGSVNKGSPVGGVSKTTFERDFPSLGAEEKSVVPDVGRIPSPGLSSAIQSLPIGNSTLIGGEKWTSALAEVPLLVGGKGIPFMQQAAPSSSSSAIGTTTGPNMAEAVAHGPSRAPIAPQLSVETQRLEELAIKKSRQLIPVTPSMPKALVLTHSDKQKAKVGQQQHPILSSHPDRHSPRGSLKGDVSKASNVGKLQVLKLVRDKNGSVPVLKGTSSPISGSKAVSSTTVATPSITGPASSRRAPSNSFLDHKLVLEKRPTPHAQSRNDFFNLVRKKSMASSSSAADSSTANTSSGVPESPSLSDGLSETEVALLPDTHQSCDTQVSADSSEHQSFEESGEMTRRDACEALKYDMNGKTHPSNDPIFSEEEEAAFLRSLGWEENSDEGGLTDEEITAFFKDVTKYINSKSSLKLLQGAQPKFVLPFDRQIGGIGGISSGLSSSDAKLES